MEDEEDEDLDDEDIGLGAVYKENLDVRRYYLLAVISQCMLNTL